MMGKTGHECDFGDIDDCVGKKFLGAGEASGDDILDRGHAEGFAKGKQKASWRHIRDRGHRLQRYAVGQFIVDILLQKRQRQI